MWSLNIVPLRSQGILVTIRYQDDSGSDTFGQAGTTAKRPGRRRLA
jgi:hypothetical protein